MSTNVFYSETKLIVETAIKTAFGVIENDKEENSLKKPNVRRKVSERFVLTMNGSIKRPRSERSSGSEILWLEEIVSTEERRVERLRNTKQQRWRTVITDELA